MRVFKNQEDRRFARQSGELRYHRFQCPLSAALRAEIGWRVPVAGRADSRAAINAIASSPIDR